jgi:hypothetical protein
MGNAQYLCAKKTWDEKHRDELVQQDPSKIKVLICTLDYYDEYAGESGATQLTCAQDGSRFLDLCLQSGVKPADIFHMTDVAEHSGTPFWPNKKNLTAALKQKATEMKALGPDGMFIFFFAGHGYHQDEGPLCSDEEDGQDEFLCLMEDTGFAMGSQIEAMVDDDMKSLVYNYFPRDNKILFVTDCCHSGTVCDLDDPVLGGHQIIHFAAVQDYQEAQDVGGGAFTSSMLEMIEDLVAQGCEEMSVDELYTNINTKFGPGWLESGSQNFNFNHTASSDPSTFPFPFFPPGYSVATVIDTDSRFT